MSVPVPPAVEPDDPRTAQLATALAVVRRRVADAATAAGRDPGSVTLVAVTKFFPAADVVRLAGLGVVDVGENREQEAAAKHTDVAALVQLARAARVRVPADPESLRWHMIGQLQTNKARAVLRWAGVVESVDRPRLVTALSRAAVDAGRVLPCLVQVNLDAVDGSDPAHDPGTGGAGGGGAGEGGAGAGRGGVAPADVAALADAVAAAEGLGLRGLMAVAPPGTDPGPPMAALARLRARVLADHPGADQLSAGMSGDLEAAVAVGATHVRIGSALLGPRPPLG